MKYLLIIFFSVAVGFKAFACGGNGVYVYAAEMSYSIDASNPMQVNLTVLMDFDRIDSPLYHDSIFVSWGDGNVTAVYADTVTVDNAATASMGTLVIYLHKYVGTHIYSALPDSGYYFISLQNQYCVNGISNIAYGNTSNTPFNVVAQVGMDSTTNSFKPPVMMPLTIAFTGLNAPFNENTFISDPDGDSISVVAVTPVQVSGLTYLDSVLEPSYVAPDVYDQQTGQCSSTLTINSNTGDLNWNSPCLSGIYTVAITVSKFKNGKLLGAIMVDQNIYASIDYTGITPNKADERLVIYPNPTTGLANITLPAGESGTIMLRDIAGNLIADYKANGSDVQQIDLSRLSAGIYMLTYQSTAGTITSRVVKQ